MAECVHNVLCIHMKLSNVKRKEKTQGECSDVVYAYSSRSEAAGLVLPTQFAPG